MKKYLYFIIILLFEIHVFSIPNIPDSIEDIKINLNTDEEIEEALNILKEYNPKIFQTLKRLKSKDPSEFSKRLMNHYYTWIHTQVLIKNLPKKEPRYRKSVKESEILLNALSESYQKANDSEKIALKEEIVKTAEKRYEIENKMNIQQLEQLKAILEKKSKEIRVFEKNKDIFINRIVTKCTREKITK